MGWFKETVLLVCLFKVQQIFSMIPLQEAELGAEYSVYEIDSRRCRVGAGYGDAATIKLSAFSPGVFLWIGVA